jgi:F-type H+-transporting ATPase subunit epsilon
MSTFFLTITKIDEVVFQGVVNSVNCPGSEGEMVVLPHHIPLITPLKEGKVKVRIGEDEEKEFSVKKGILEVSKDEVVILL